MFYFLALCAAVYLVYSDLKTFREKQNVPVQVALLTAFFIIAVAAFDFATLIFGSVLPWGVRQLVMRSIVPIICAGIAYAVVRGVYWKPMINPDNPPLPPESGFGPGSLALVFVVY